MLSINSSKLISSHSGMISSIVIFIFIQPSLIMIFLFCG
jgi:hypothetical protein